MKKTIFAGLIALSSLTFVQCDCPFDNKCSTKEKSPACVEAEALTPNSNVDARLKTYAKVPLTSDISHLSKQQKQLLGKLFEVADIMNNLFWRQSLPMCKGGFLSRIENKNAKEFAIINYGPWDRLDGNKPFFKEIGAKPLGANFYPQDMTKEEFEALKDDNKTSLYTLIRRDDKGALKTVWYHEAYKEELEKAAQLLNEAADLAESKDFAAYLKARAKSFLTDDYYASDLAWMKMTDNKIDFVVGPIENYEDALFGYKAAFESFILLKDMEWSKKLSKFSAMLPDLQKILPVEPIYKREVPGSDADINAYDVVYYAGDCNAGSKTIAINLPNDEKVHLAMGSRKLQLKNAMKAKFDQILIPISEILIDPAQRKHVKFTAFFENTMFHEVGHAMGVKKTIDGKTTARKALKEAFSSLEEGKADIMGLWLVSQLYKKGELNEGTLMDNYVTFFTSIFRSVRFGVASSHGKANMLRYYYFQERGVFTMNEDGTYTINAEKMQQATEELMKKILKIQGDGDYQAAKEWLAAKAIVTPEFQKVLDKIEAAGIPVDISYIEGPKELGLK